MRQARLKIITTAIISVFATACGTANVNKIFGSKDESYASLLDRAQQEYDLGNFSDAEKLALQAYDKAENNGDAGVLLGSIYLSQAGIDIFQMISKLSSLSSSSGSNGSTTTSCAQSSSSGSSSTNILSELSCKLLNLSDADVAALGTTVQTATSSRYSGLSSLNISSVYIPNSVTDTVRSNVSVLAAIDKGVKKLCPFISRSLVISKSSDSRHTTSSVCPDSTGTFYNGSKAHIAFALLNLVETLVMQRGILIDGATAASATTPTGVNGVNSAMKSATSVTTLAAASNSYINLISDVFATSDANSQLSLALNGLVVVNASFGAAGVPSSVTKSLDTQISALKTMSSSLGGSQVKALQGQMNEKYAKDLASKINTQCPSLSTSGCTTNQTSLCNSYCSISTGVDPSKVTKPTICASYTCP